MKYRINVYLISMRMCRDYQDFCGEENIKNMKSSTQCKVAQIFQIVKHRFGYSKDDYNGLAKNINCAIILSELIF